MGMVVVNPPEEVIQNYGIFKIHAKSLDRSPKFIALPLETLDGHEVRL